MLDNKVPSNDTELPDLHIGNAGAVYQPVPSEKTPLVIIPRVPIDETATKLPFGKKIETFYNGASTQLMMLLAYQAANHVFIKRNDLLFFYISTGISSIASMFTALQIATSAYMLKHNIDDWQLEANLNKFNNLIKSAIDIPNQFYIYYQLLANAFETFITGLNEDAHSAKDIYFHFLLILAFMYSLSTFKPINDLINKVSERFLSKNKHFIFGEARYWFNQLLKFYTITGVPTNQMVKVIRLLFSRHSGAIIENFMTKNAKSIFSTRLILSAGVATILTKIDTKEQRQLNENPLNYKPKKYVDLLNHIEMSVLVAIVIADTILAAIEHNWVALALYAALFAIMELLYLSLNNYTCQKAAYNVAKAVTISLSKSPVNIWNEQLTVSKPPEISSSVTIAIPYTPKEVLSA